MNVRRDGPPSHVGVYRPPPPQQTPEARERELFYKRAAWRRCRAHKLQLNPMCEPCAARGLDTPATQVHHKVDLEERKDLAYDLANLESICQECHSKITMSRNQGRWRRNPHDRRPRPL